MTLLPFAAAIVVVVAAIATVAGRRPALVAIGSGLLFAVAPLVADLGPATVVLAERGVGGALVGEILWLGLRGRTLVGATALGWPSLALLATAAFVAGAAGPHLLPDVADGAAVAGTAAGGAAAGAAFALAVTAAVAVAGRADGIHLGLCGLVLVAATSVIQLALSGPTSTLETLLVAGAGVVVATAVAVLVPRTEAADRPVENGRSDGVPRGRTGSGSAIGIESRLPIERGEAPRGARR